MVPERPGQQQETPGSPVLPPARVGQAPELSWASDFFPVNQTIVTK